MQEINLLQNKLKDKTDQFDKNNRLIMIVLSLLLVVVLVATGAFYMLTQSTQEAKVVLDQESMAIQTKLDQLDEQLTLAKGFQAQSKNITSLLNTHIIWSGFIKELADSTYKTSRYAHLQLSTEGVVVIEGRTPEYTHLGKLLLALETSDQIGEVRLMSTATSSEGQEAGVNFTIEAGIDTSVLTSQQN